MKTTTLSPLGTQDAQKPSNSSNATTGGLPSPRIATPSSTVALLVKGQNHFVKNLLACFAPTKSPKITGRSSPAISSQTSPNPKVTTPLWSASTVFQKWSDSSLSTKLSLLKWLPKNIEITSGRTLASLLASFPTEVLNLCLHSHEPSTLYSVSPKTSQRPATLKRTARRNDSTKRWNSTFEFFVAADKPTGLTGWLALSFRLTIKSIRQQVIPLSS